MLPRSRALLLVLFLLGGLFLSGFSARAASAPAEIKPYAITGSYSILEGAGFDGIYRFDPSFRVRLSFLEQRWQLRGEYLPVSNLVLQAGYDWTEEKYLAGLEHEWRLGENIMLLSEATGFRPRAAGKYLLDYLCRFRIGIGEDNAVYAGVEGEYVPGKPHNPEFFVELDLNWYLRHGWRLRFEPHIMVEGEISHRTTLSRKWDNGVEGGIFVGQDRDSSWDAGFFVQL